MNDADREALRAYRRTHWGLSGNARVVNAKAPDPRVGTLVQLGTLVSVVYLTRKLGDLEATEYEHEFAEERAAPRLCFNATGLVIVGGDYRVTTHGIVG